MNLELLLLKPHMLRTDSKDKTVKKILKLYSVVSLFCVNNGIVIVKLLYIIKASK